MVWRGVDIMTSAPFDYRSELMHKSYDAKASNRSRKIAAVERLLKVIYRRAAPDYRLVHRFREWQQNDLNQMLSNYMGQQQWKEHRHYRGLLLLLNSVLLRGLHVTLTSWRFKSKLLKRSRLTPTKLLSAGQITAVLLRKTLQKWAKCNFSISSSLRSPIERINVLLLAVNRWKTASVGHLLYYNRRGMGAVRICQWIYGKITPLLQGLYEKLALKRGWKPGIRCLVPVLKMKTVKQMQIALMSLHRNRFLPSNLEKIHVGLMQFQAILINKNRKKRLNYGLWRLRSFSGIFPSTSSLLSLFSCLKRHYSQVKMKAVVMWRGSGGEDREAGFEMDLEIIRNQMQVARMLETQTIERRSVNVRLVQRMKLKELERSVWKGMREGLRRWRMCGVRNDTNEDVLFEYVRFLEEQNGIHPSRLPPSHH